MRYPTVVVREDVLGSWLTVAGYTKSQLASELRVTRGRVSQIIHSSEEPSAHLIAKLMTLTQIPFDRLFKIVRNAPGGAGNGKTLSFTHTTSRKKALQVSSH